VLDEGVAVVVHLRLDVRREQDLLKGGCHGCVVLLGNVPLLLIGRLPETVPSRALWPTRLK
jgi:hypothetical protein